MGIPRQLNKEIAFLMLVLIEDYQSYKDRGSEQVASRRWKRERDGWWFRRHWQTARLIMDFNVDVTLFTKVLNDLQKKKKNLAYYRRPSDLGSNQSFWRSSFCRLPVSATFGKWSSQCVCGGGGEPACRSSTNDFSFQPRAPCIWVFNIYGHSLQLLTPLFCYLKGPTLHIKRPCCHLKLWMGVCIWSGFM